MDVLELTDRGFVRNRNALLRPNGANKADVDEPPLPAAESVIWRVNSTKLISECKGTLPSAGSNIALTVSIKNDSPTRPFFQISPQPIRMGRITYPRELYKYLISLCDERKCTWDCATGSGQAASDLSEHFDCVIATDISDSLLSHAKKRENIEFRNAAAEKSGIASDSVKSGDCCPGDSLV